MQHPSGVAALSLHIATTAASGGAAGSSSGTSARLKERLAGQLALQLSAVVVLLAAVWALIQHAAQSVLARLVGSHAATAAVAAAAAMVAASSGSSSGAAPRDGAAGAPSPAPVQHAAAMAPAVGASGSSGGALAFFGAGALRRRSPPPHQQQQQPQQCGGGATSLGVVATGSSSSSTTTATTTSSSCSVQASGGRCSNAIPRQLPEHRGRLTIVLDLDETLLATYRLLQGGDSDALQLVPSSRPAPPAAATTCSSGSSSGRLSFKSLFGGGSSGASGTGAWGGYTLSTRCPGFGELGVAARASAWMTYTPPPAAAGPSAPAAAGPSAASTAAPASGSSGSAAAVLSPPPPGPHTLAVFERPGCREFLGAAAALGELVLFTAAGEGYAAPLADLLDPQGRLFRARLYGDACVSLAGRRNVKDLRVLGRELGRVVLVDNCLFSFLAQPSNGLPVAPFRGAPGDAQLLGVILPLLRALGQVAGDVRPLLDSMFGVNAWLASRGYAGAGGHEVQAGQVAHQQQTARQQQRTHQQ